MTKVLNAKNCCYVLRTVRVYFLCNVNVKNNLNVTTNFDCSHKKKKYFVFKIRILLLD